MTKQEVRGGSLELLAASLCYETGVTVYKPEMKFEPFLTFPNPRAQEEIEFVLDNIDDLYIQSRLLNLVLHSEDHYDLIVNAHNASARGVGLKPVIPRTNYDSLPLPEEEPSLLSG
jgi:hypothetical protein